MSALPPGAAGTSALGNDATRFHQIASTPGRPFRDFQVEFPPVSLGLIEAIGHGDSLGTAIRLGWIGLLLDLAIAGMLFLGWGEEVATRYLVLGTPMVFFLYLRLDLLSMVLAVAGLLLVRRGKQAWGGVALAAGVFAKLCPIVLLPLLVFRRQWRALGWAVGSIAAGTAAWVRWGGAGAPIQVITYRHAAGWDVESVIGSVSWVVTGQHAGDAVGRSTYRIDLQLGAPRPPRSEHRLHRARVVARTANSQIGKAGRGGFGRQPALVCHTPCSSIHELAPAMGGDKRGVSDSQGHDCSLHSYDGGHSRTATPSAWGRTIDLAMLLIRNALVLVITITAYSYLRTGKKGRSGNRTARGATGVTPRRPRPSASS